MLRNEQQSREHYLHQAAFEHVARVNASAGNGTQINTNGRPLAKPAVIGAPALFYTERNRRNRDCMKRILIFLIKIYQWCLSPFFGGQCRFYPSCSAYAVEAIDIHGPLRGTWLAVERLGRCSPF